MRSAVTLDQGTIAYSETGPADGAPAIVFVHGAFVDGTLWRKVVPRLEGTLALRGRPTCRWART